MTDAAQENDDRLEDETQKKKSQDNTTSSNENLDCGLSQDASATNRQHNKPHLEVRREVKRHIV